jgi:hypothetical protein
MQLHKAVQTSNGKAQPTTSFHPSQGQPGTYEKITGRLYVRTRSKRNQSAGFRKLPKVLSSIMLQSLERRNVTVQRVRYALAFGTGIALGTLAYFAMGFRL